MIATNLFGNCGNHLSGYAICRIVAEKLGYDWGVNPVPSHDYHNGMNQMYFMDVDFGKPISGIVNEFSEKWLYTYHNGEKINITMYDENVFKIQDNTILKGGDGALGGIYQAENYYIDRRSDIINWFKILPEYEDRYEQDLKNNNIVLDNDTCVINFRGGEYRSIPNVLLKPKYWSDAITHMRKNNPAMKFVVVSDDLDLARQFMGNIPYCYIHKDIGFDYYLVNNAKWLIIANSSFSLWAAFLNVYAGNNMIIAPKYWARWNTSDWYWATTNINRTFTYLDRNNNLSNYEHCYNEMLENYKRFGVI